MTLQVTEIQRFCMTDGPGVRTTVFLKGCPLHCAWCHNPETATAEVAPLLYNNRCIGCRACEAVCPLGAHQITQTEHVFCRDLCKGCYECARACPTEALKPLYETLTTDEILKKVLSDKAFYGEKGGLTLSGGEPMMQPEGSLELMNKAKAAGITTAVETCGVFPARYLKPLAEACDYFLWDLKDTDPTRLKQYTGADLSFITDNLRALDEFDKPIHLRCILVNGVNTEEAHYQKIIDIARSLRHVIRVEWLPYHAYAGSKMLPLGHADNGRPDWLVPDEELQKAQSYADRAHLS